MELFGKQELGNGGSEINQRAFVFCCGARTNVLVYVCECGKVVGFAS